MAWPACIASVRPSPARNSCSVKRLRSSRLVALIQSVYPGQPFTLGGTSRFWPSCADRVTSGARSAWLKPNCRTVPTIKSTGDLTRLARLPSAQKLSLSSNSRRATAMSKPLSRNRATVRSRSACSDADLACGDTHSRHSLPTTKRAEAGWSSIRSSIWSPLKLAVWPNTVLLPPS